MTVVARTIRSTPYRTSVETWRFIADLIAWNSATARTELGAVEGVASSLIADEMPERAPIVVAGSGPRLRVYCMYGEDAIAGEGASEEALTWDPTKDDWHVYLPVSEEEIEWVSASLKKIGSRVVAYNCDEDAPVGSSTDERVADFQVDVEAFKKP